ncbi:site-specific integrase, partial [Streptomyces sp. MCAF7]
MSGARRAGGIAKRCECRGPNGKRLGTKCPQLSKRSHGNYEIHQELPVGESGTRRRFRRSGYAKVTDAQSGIDRIRALLDLAEDDEEAARRIGDLLMTVMTERKPIPEPAEVLRRLGSSMPLDNTMTVGQWLDTWIESKKTKRRTTNSYKSHIRVHLKPGVGHYRLDRLNGLN